MLIGYCLGVPFEKKFVNFKGTNNILRCILRILGGGVIYLGLNAVLKLPFPKELLESATTLSFLIRTVRYAIIIFVVIGVYPLVFDRINLKKNK